MINKEPKLTEEKLCKLMYRFARHSCVRRHIPISLWDDVCQEACITAVKCSRRDKLLSTRSFFWLAYRAIKKVVAHSKWRQESCCLGSNKYVGEDDGGTMQDGMANTASALAFVYGTQIQGWNSQFHPGA